MTNESGIVIERLKAVQKISLKGTPFWMARDIMEVLDYKDWRVFRQVIERAKTSSEKSGNASTHHFVVYDEVIVAGNGARLPRENFALSQYACYLVAMNGDTSKPEIANSQAYFTDKTYKQEQLEALPENERRLITRNRVKDGNLKLNDAAQLAGVTSKMFGVFHDAGYKGMYGGKGMKAVKAHKNIPESEHLLDCINRAELAAHEFRITQTEEKLRIQEIKGQQRAIDTHEEVGKKIRQTMKEMGNTMPEDLPAAPSIKKLAAAKAREAKKLQSSNESR
jgi:DNA-damage-inducible protein D